MILDIYNKSEELNSLLKTDEGRSKLIEEYNAYEVKKEREESLESIHILILDNNIAIDFPIKN